MTTENHSPAPWAAWPDDGTGTKPCVLSSGVNAGGNFYVAQCVSFADARLIAAAPDLLKALQNLNHMGGDDRGGFCLCPLQNGAAPNHKHASICSDVRLAIAKATGVSL